MKGNQMCLDTYFVEKRDDFFINIIWVLDRMLTSGTWISFDITK